MRERMKVRRCIWVLAAVLGAGIGVGAVPAMAAQSSQDHAHDQDYSKNKNYQTGMRDGKNDKAHHKDHSRNRKFKKDDDQKAYEAGYQMGHQDDPPDHH